MTGERAGVTSQIGEAMPFLATLGATVESFDDDAAVLRLEIRPELHTAGGAVHGGVIMGLADSAGGILAFRALPPGAIGTTTLTSSTTFLRRATGPTLWARAELTHAGHSTIVVSSAITDEAGRSIARVVQSQLVLRPRPPATRQEPA